MRVAGAIAEDRVLSPYTGWTRAHWEELADRLLLAVRPYATPGQALIHLPGPPSGSGRHSDGLEGYARTFLLAAFRIAGAGGGAGGPGHGEAEVAALAERYAAGLTAGTDPASPERWPRMSECNQAKVEAASIALGLHETRPWIWDRLDASVRTRVVDWLSEMVGTGVPDNNWVWFQAVVEAFLRSVGGPWDPRDIEHTVVRTESWYAGGGWYSDGADTPAPFRNFDHYSGWAMHLYPLWYCRISGEAAESGLADRYRARLRSYLRDLQHLVGGDGAPLYQGRSLTYRYAAAAPFWADQLFGAGALRPGLTRRIGSGMVRHFTDRGSPDRQGLLPLGWYGPHAPIRQSYSGPASPYWASKAFAGLLLPADHPAWTDAEEPLPVERTDFVRALTAPGWVVSGTRADGIVRIANHGADHADRGSVSGHAYDPFYSRWAYSTATGPELGGTGPATVPGAGNATGADPGAEPDGDHDAEVRPSTPDLDLPGRGPLDSHVALLDAEGRPSHRRPLYRVVSDPVGVGVGGEGVGHGAVSIHRARWPRLGGEEGDGAEAVEGAWLTTGSVLHGPWEVRAVLVEGGDPAASGLRLRIGGWAVAGAEPPVREIAADRALVRTADGLLGRVVALHGPLLAGVRRSTGRTSYGAHAAVGYLETSHAVRSGELYVAGIALGRSAEAAGAAPSVTVAGVGAGVVVGVGAVVEVVWPDGSTDVLRLNGNARTAPPVGE